MENYLEAYKDAKRNLKHTVRQITFKKMAIDNISHLLPEVVRIKNDSWRSSCIVLNFKEENITADVFDKTVAIISKRLMQNPSMYINQYSMDANWSLFFKYDNVRVSIGIELTTNNTEACEVITKEVTRTETELTGYCKALSEKKYFQTSNTY